MGDEVLFNNSLSMLNLRGIKPDIEEALNADDPRQSLGRLASFHASFVVAAWCVHNMGRQIKEGKIDCDTLNELRSLMPAGAVFHRLPEWMDKLANAAQNTRTYFVHIASDLDDDELYERYVGLARLTARMVNSYHAELYNRDTYAAQKFEQKVHIKLMEFGCTRELQWENWPFPQWKK